MSMNDSDKIEFKALFDGLADYYYPKDAGDRNPHRIGKIPMQLYFGVLQRFSIDQITEAATAHLNDTNSGKFFPKASDLIRHIEGGEITPDMIVASAKLANSPLGILCRIHIGSWDLDNQDSFYLRQRAVECQMLIPQWKSRAMAGDYTDHEISIMVKHGVNPVSPFSDGLQSPNNPQALLDRVNAITASPRHKYLIESNSDEITTGQAHPRVLAFLEAENKTV